MRNDRPSKGLMFLGRRKGKKGAEGSSQPRADCSYSRKKTESEADMDEDCSHQRNRRALWMGNRRNE